MLLADRADANDQLVAKYGEAPPGQAQEPPDDGRSYVPHFRTDLDRDLGLLDEDDDPYGSDDDTNVVVLADWIAQANKEFEAAKGK